MADAGPEQAQQEREQQESLARIEAGGIPLSAERRLRELGGASRPGGVGGGSFTSDLSVNGFALCHQLGLKPLSQVMGSSIYQIGYQGAWGSTGYSSNAILIELDTLTQALNEVRGRALVRLGEEARLLGADAVVGVQTRAGESQLDTGTLALEHVVVGTAVRREGAHAKHPVLTELSVAEYAMLVRGGFEPLGIVAWSSVFFTSYVFGGMAGGGMLGGGSLTMGVRNFELREFTQAMYSAREAVMQQITGQAASLGAAGVVGVQIGHTVRPHTLSGGMGMGGGLAGGRELRGLMVTFTAVGTAIQQHGDATIPAPKPTIDLFT
ncbi:MAG: heavy metal-binding domain-containing protein [Solirubrobacteraceae bacterium]